MSLIALVVFACIGSFIVAGLALAAYASMPEKFLNHADLGRYSGLASVAAAAADKRNSAIPIGGLQDQSA
jgi:hypothetical protein